MQVNKRISLTERWWAYITEELNESLCPTAGGGFMHFSWKTDQLQKLDIVC